MNHVEVTTAEIERLLEQHEKVAKTALTFTPRVLKGRELSALAWDHFGVRRGWLETDKGLRKRIVWSCYSGAKNSPHNLPPLTRFWRCLCTLGKASK